MSLLKEYLAKPATASKTLTDHCVDAMRYYFNDMRRQYGSAHSDSLTEPHAGLEVTGCSTFVWNVLMYGYEKMGRKDIAMELNSMERDGLDAEHKVEDSRGNVIGTRRSRGGGLGAFLIKQGWKAHYWNPDVWTPRDQSSQHVVSFKDIRAKLGYYGVKPSGLVVGYNKTTRDYDDNVTANYKDEGEQNKKTFAALEKEKFCIIIPRGAMHTACMLNGYVWEVHWNQYKDIKETRGLYQVVRLDSSGDPQKDSSGKVIVLDYRTVKKDVLKNASAWFWRKIAVDVYLYQNDTRFIDWEWLDGLVFTVPGSTFTSRTIADIRVEASMAP